MTPRPINPARDLAAVADLLSRTRASGGLSHPGGIQWWMRDLWLDRDGFEIFVVDGEGDRSGRLEGFVLIDNEFVVAEHEDGDSGRHALVAWTEEHMRSGRQPKLMTHAVEGTDLERQLLAEGYERTGMEYELMIDTAGADEQPPLPDGYHFGSLLDTTDEAYIDGHRAAWSDTRPSPYRLELHDAVKRMPQFRPDLVTIALALDGTVASYCIAWIDERSETVEIEPLGTHRDHRRKGLAHAVVKEVHRRAKAHGARRALVWNDPKTNPAAYGLYTGAGMNPHRTLTEMTKALT
jgi:GNAT superfamily N-acetyltransferase